MPAALAKVHSVSGNDRCCDCGVLGPEWVSITLSSLVCIRCAGAHRELGVRNSRIRSLNLDSWSPPQISRLLAGGNSRLKAALRRSGVAWTVTREPISAAVARSRYNPTVTALYTSALDAQCPLRCCSSDDDDEPPEFGRFVIDRAPEVDVGLDGERSEKGLEPGNKATRTDTSLMGCIATSYFTFFKSLTQFCARA